MTTRLDYGRDLSLRPADKDTNAKTEKVCYAGNDVHIRKTLPSTLLETRLGGLGFSHVDLQTQKVRTMEIFQQHLNIRSFAMTKQPMRSNLSTSCMVSCSAFAKLISRDSGWEPLLLETLDAGELYETVPVAGAHHHLRQLPP